MPPRGRGDVTETRVLLHLTSGGPYVPTPLIYPLLMVPGDNGRMLFYDAACKLVAEDRFTDHFSSSPVGAEGKIYWCSERGKTYVLDPAGLSGKKSGEKPSIKLLSVNPLHGAILATPAIAAGRLTVGSSGRYRFALRLTSLGCSRLRQARRDNLELRFSNFLAFTPAHGPSLRYATIMYVHF